MSTINFTAYYCGMSEDLFADNIMIFQPVSYYSKSYDLENNLLSTMKLSDAIQLFKDYALKDDDALGNWGVDGLQVDTIYLRSSDAFLGIQEDKLLADMYAYFSCDYLEFVYIYVAGGASFWCNGYQFIVHPNEDIHRHHPHVHVRHDDNETRYSLDTLTRFPNDTFSRDFKRDEKKKILPYLRKNQAKLRRYWDNYLNGYIPPIEDEEGKQYYRES